MNQSTTFTYDAQGDLTHSVGPRGDLPDVTDIVYDLDRRATLSVQPDPDGAGSHPRPAGKSVYDDVGRVIETDRGTTTSATGSDFAVNNWMKDVYDPAGEKVLETTGYGTTTPVTTTAAQFSYDGAGRTVCSARRMNPSVFATLPSDACALGPAGSYGPDRISKSVYSSAGQVLQEQRAVGTSIAQTYATHSYNPDGKEASVFDALGATHTTTYAYDGFDRLKKTTFPDTTFVQNTTIDADGNVKKLKNRAGENINYTFDRNDRMATKVVPATAVSAANTITWTYDMTGTVTNLSDTNGNTIASTYDAMGRQLTSAQTIPGMGGATKTVTYAYDDGAGDKVNRSRVTWPDGYYVNYGYDALNHMTSATDSGGTALATQTYDDLARPATVQYPAAQDNVVTSWNVEDDLVTMTNNFFNTTNDVSYTNTFTPAHQWNASSVTNATYKYVPANSGTDVYPTVNSLNQYTSMTPAGGSSQSLTYDTRGNLTSDTVLTLAYDPENHLMTAQKGGVATTYAYDPLGRRKTKTVGVGGTVTNFVHDGDTEIGDYDASGNVIRRYVPGPAIDQPIAMVTAAGVKTMFHTDKMGSVVAMSNATNGHLVEGPYTYDAYGNCFDGGSPCGSGVPYRYTGQRLDPETGLYYYRARCYSPSLGRFCQTDPVGYKDDLNQYLYVHDDPTDATDPSGLACDGSSSCNAPALAQGTAIVAAQTKEAVVNHPGESMQVVGTVISMVPMPVAKVVGGTVTEVGTVVRAVDGENTAIVPSANAAREGPEAGGLPKPPRGPGSVPKAQRDPRRTWSPTERAAKRDQQGEKCGNGCGTSIDASNSQAHHIDRHADGGPTNNENHSEVCIDCHKALHSPEESRP